MSKKESRAVRRKKRLLLASTVIFGLSLGYLGGGVGAGFAVFSLLFDRRGSTPSSLSQPEFLARKQQKDYPRLAKREEHAFRSGSNTLTGYFYAVDDPKGVFLLAHGMGSLSDGAESALSDWLVGLGFDVFSLDLTASGRSEGRSMVSLSQSRFDVLAGEKYLRTLPGLEGLGLGLVGYSWGGYGVLSSLRVDPSPRWVLSFSAFANPRFYMKEIAKNYVGFLAELSSPCFSLAYGCRYGEDSLDAVEEGRKANETKIAFVQGEEDQTVPFSSRAFSLAQKNPEPQWSFFSLPGVGHDAPWFSLPSQNAYQEALQSCPKDEEKRGQWARSLDLEKTSAWDKALQKELEEWLLA